VTLKKIVFQGSSLDVLRGWPESAKKLAGHQLDRVQRGLEPDDWKPMQTVGIGVREIRMATGAGAFRVIYVQVVRETVHVLHCFQKKSQRTPKPDIDLARRRLKALNNAKW